MVIWNMVIAGRLVEQGNDFDEDDPRAQTFPYANRQDGPTGHCGNRNGRALTGFNLMDSRALQVAS
jgi:hypothetical protein